MTRLAIAIITARLVLMLGTGCELYSDPDPADVDGGTSLDADVPTIAGRYAVTWACETEPCGSRPLGGVDTAEIAVTPGNVSIAWLSADAVVASHAGELSGACAAVPEGVDAGVSRAGYSVCPVAIVMGDRTVDALTRIAWSTGAWRVEMTRGGGA